MAFSYVTSDINSDDSTATSIATPAVSVSAGDLVVFMTRWEGGGASDATTMTASDNLTNTWSTTRYRNAGGSEDQRVAMSWAKASGAGSMTVTGTFSVTRGFRRAIVLVFSTPAATVVEADLDNSGSDAQSTSWSAGTVDYVNADLIIVGNGAYNGASDPQGAPSGFTATSSGSLFTAFRQIMSGASSLTVNGTYPVADSHAAIAMVLRESGAAAVLTSPTPSGTIGTSTTATIGCTTTQNVGTFYCVVDSAANLSGVTPTQIKAGQRASGAAALAANNSAISTTTPSAGVTGLSGSTLYSYAIIQSNANGDSNVVTGTFTTAATTYGASINLVNNAGSAYASTSFQWQAQLTFPGGSIVGSGTTSSNGAGVLAVTGVTSSGSGFLTGRDTSTGLIVFGPTPVTFA